MKKNVRPTDFRLDKEHRLAGGYGPYAAVQDAEAKLRRLVMANLLWEKLAYVDGESVANAIRETIPQVDPRGVYNIAVEARTAQKLRHVPLLIAREMARLKTHKHLVGLLLPQIILRADELTEFLALYWMDGKQPLSAQVKKGLAAAFLNFDEYQLAKYNRETQVKLRDVMFLSHPRPVNGTGNTKKDRRQGELDSAGWLFNKLATDLLATPYTWETELSAGKDKKETWERLIRARKMPALAFVRNLRNIINAGVSREVMMFAFENINTRWLLPLDYIKAAKYAPQYERELEVMMLKGLGQAPKLPGYSILVVDVSGSMNMNLSEKSDFNRLDAAAANAMLAAEMCEHVTIYATAGSDWDRTHETALLKPRRGFALAELIQQAARELGGGGIFTRQCLEYIRAHETTTPDRIIIFSDSQDCDRPGLQTPKPFGKRNYIVDVSAHEYGVNYKGLWTAEIAGWSEHFLKFIAALEGQSVSDNEE